MADCGIDGVKFGFKDSRLKLRTGEFICNKHWKQAGFGLTDSPKEYSLDEIKERLQNIQTLETEHSKGKVTKDDIKAFGYLSSKHLENLDSNSFESVKHISNQLAGSGLTQAGIALGFTGNAADRLSLNFQNALVEQNWIIIRQNQEIIELLKKNNDDGLTK
ncbi:hypothetical protein [Levilactobacillus senmaizukei]|uniref:hypothetical protein n=1 Tax=Levilactobacillus senmaizukei TaxID=431273 RepID=UPI00077BB662|nr:hypothetical protein [Levilactobacillus senmaizukei]